jgi:hypothetical protein
MKEESMHRVFALLAVLSVVAGSRERDVPHKPLFPTVGLKRGEVEAVELSNGTKAKVKLLEVEKSRDSLRPAVRQTRELDTDHASGQTADRATSIAGIWVSGQARPLNVSGRLSRLRPVDPDLGGRRDHGVAQKFAESGFWRFLSLEFDHIPWSGCAFWDLIRPAFMLMAGVVIPRTPCPPPSRSRSYSGGFSAEGLEDGTFPKEATSRNAAHEALKEPADFRARAHHPRS